MQFIARMSHALQSRDREDGRATWQPQGVGSEAYLNGTSQEVMHETSGLGVFHHEKHQEHEEGLYSIFF
ncbi:MAG: hypothetical protein LJE88_03525 [Deltaproteobacteria bacterium]|nr:hypothetical protein [Deltaproteobacteria bacterium]